MPAPLPRFSGVMTRRCCILSLLRRLLAGDPGFYVVYYDEASAIHYCKVPAIPDTFPADW